MVKSTEKKQIIFRLDEETHRKLQLYALQRNKSIQELMENSVHEMVNSGRKIGGHLLKVVQNAINHREQELKDSLIKGFKRSVFFKTEAEFVIQVFIDEFGEVHIEKSWTKNSPSDENAYLLYEFKSMDMVDILISNRYLDDLVMDGLKSIQEPSQGMDSFAKWLIKSDKLTLQEDDSDWSSEEIIHYVFHSTGCSFRQFFDYMYEWNRSSATQVSAYLLKMLETEIMGEEKLYLDERIESAWREIIERPELGM